MLSKNPGIVEDSNYGVYIWRDGKGRAVVDSELQLHAYCVASGDLKNIKLLEEAARSFGIMDGGPEFCAGSRPISEGEFEEQKARQEAGSGPGRVRPGQHD
jgi:hypothetical protein